MTSDEIISRYGLFVIHEPMPEEIERAMSEGRRLRAQAFRDTVHVAARVLIRAFRGRAGPLTPAESATIRVHAA